MRGLTSTGSLRGETAATLRGQHRQGGHGAGDARRLGHGGRRGSDEGAAELLLPDEEVGAVDNAVAVGVALRVGGTLGRAHAERPGGQVVSVDVVVFVKVGFERGNEREQQIAAHALQRKLVARLEVVDKQANVFGIDGLAVAADVDGDGERDIERRWS